MFDAHDIVERLTRRFGLGSRPELRKALYERLGELCEAEGERAYHIIATAVADAVGKRNPSGYFCFVVMRRLIDRGVIPAKEVPAF